MRNYKPTLLYKAVCLQCMSRVCEHFAPPEHLTAQEFRVLDLLSRGLSNKEIAFALHIVPGTVKVYCYKLSLKLGLTSRLELGLWGAHNLAALQAAVTGPPAEGVPSPS